MFMSFRSRLAAATLLLGSAIAAGPAGAVPVSYSFSATGGHTGSFTYNDAASSIGNGPFACCGTAYNAISFIVDGTAYANPLLALYTNYGGNQFAEFTTVGGYPYLQLSHAGTNLFSSSAANQMNGRTMADFNLTQFNYLSIGGRQYSLSSVTYGGATRVAEPSTLLLFGIGLIGFALVYRRIVRNK
jgi:hypothetical protein